MNKRIYVLILMLLTSTIFAQEEQAGIDMAASFPKVTEGNEEPDLPSNGFYWQADNPGSGINIEVQSRPSSSTGYLLFLAGYFYDENNEQFWCAGSAEYEFNADVHQWRDAKDFSNWPRGHDDLPILAEQDVTCSVMTGGTPIGSNEHVQNRVDRTINLHLLWRNPSYIELTAENGSMQVFKRFGWHDDLVDPSLDWILDYEWMLMSSIPQYGHSQNDESKPTKSIFNSNLTTSFERLDVTDHEKVRQFVGHQEHYDYYISTIENSNKIVSSFGFENTLVDIFAPYINGGQSNFTWILLVHDSLKNRVMAYTLAGINEPDELKPFAGGEIKFVANVNPDADVLDFYPLLCEGLALVPAPPGGNNEGHKCEFNHYRSHSISSMASWSPQNIHRSTMKMFKIKTGGKAYLFQPNNGESDSQSMLRIKQMMIDDELL